MSAVRRSLAESKHPAPPQRRQRALSGFLNRVRWFDSGRGIPLAMRDAAHEQALPGVRERTTRGTTKHSPGIDAGEALLVLRRCGFAPGQPESQKDSREH